MADPAPDLTALLASLSAALLPPTTSASLLSSPSDLSFSRALSRPLARSLDSTSSRVFSLVEKVLSWSDIGRLAEGKSKVDGEMVVEGAYRDIVDRVEWLLEGADGGLESFYNNRSTSSKAPTTTPAILPAAAAPSTARLASHLLLAPNLAKPQLLFPAHLRPLPPSISAFPSEEPLWKPLLPPSSIPNSDPTLRIESYLPQQRDYPSSTSPLLLIPDIANPSPLVRYQHLFFSTLSNLTPPSALYHPPSERPEKPGETSFDDTKFEVIDTKEAFGRLVEEIRAVGKEGKKELAVDLEHHETRSWWGITCLMQLSTRDKDYLIDVLDPVIREEVVKLNEFFTDPDWIKVFHGASSDILWLQRDFGLYIVGLFDTYHACNVLELPQRSLASLLSKYTNFTPDKRYQLADWRIRPLPSAMSHYARSDTHFLLQIYDLLRLDILVLPSSTQALTKVFELSAETSSNLFELKPYDPLYGRGDAGFRGLLGKWRKMGEYDDELFKIVNGGLGGGEWGPGGASLEVLRAVHKWREVTAREEDESPNYVMRNDFLFSLVEAKPVTVEGVMRLGRVSEVARKRVGEVVEAVKEGLGRVGNVEGIFVKETVESLEIVAEVGKDLWGEQKEETPVVATSSSSFFGKGKKVDTKGKGKATTSLVSKKSSFFGKGEKKVVVVEEDAEKKRKDEVKRVQGLLVLGGGLAESLRPKLSIPPPIPTQSLAALIESTADVVMTTVDPIPEPLSFDHTFVPRSARQPDTDVLVVSSIPSSSKKGKKRPSDPESTSAIPTPKKQKQKKQPKEPQESLPAFDYSTSKSILDAELPNTSSGTTKGGNKGKKGEKSEKSKKGFEMDTSGFGKQPREKTQSKKGNISRSFA